MHIIHIASELTPLAKVGGLADVVLGLARELSWKGHDVDIILPKYDCMDISQIRDLTVEDDAFFSYYDGQMHLNLVWKGWVENIKVFFIDPHHNRYFFNRGCIYGCKDDIERFLYFSRASLDFLQKKNIAADILHIHDWQTAVIAPLMKEVFTSKNFSKTKVVSTIHNIEYQGICAPFNLDWIGLKSTSFHTEETLQDQTYPEAVNLLKGSFIFADFITTVSPRYAEEVKVKPYGKGLESVVIKNAFKFKGILNGIDYSLWNPEIDPYLPVHYSARELPTKKGDFHILDNKAFVKKTLRERLLLEEDFKPIVGCITRLVPQKGIDLIKHALKRTLEKGGQFVLLGSSPIPEISKEFHALKNKYGDHPQVHFTLHHQEELAHMIFAGSDIFIVPSIFEPCGLTQMIALKYGSIPLVRKTGGLADTIYDIDNKEAPESKKNGYIFELPTEESFNLTFDRAISTFFNEPEKWRNLMIKGMKMDFSWNIPCNDYIEIYQTLGHDSQKL